MLALLSIAQIILAVLLVVSILVQQRGTTLGGAFGAETSIYRTRRGAERYFFLSTVVLAILFFTTAVLNLIF
jgi:protein translocase SecG subunit